MEGKMIKFLAAIILALVFTFVVVHHNQTIAAHDEEVASYADATADADRELTTMNKNATQYRSSDRQKALEELGYERVLNYAEDAITMVRLEASKDRTYAVTLKPSNYTGLSHAILTVYDGQSTTLNPTKLTEKTTIETVISWKNGY
ncbi:hypothetical protein [Kurthia huakuii]|uniref:hypothetical protein n=1 Tax=Kurthia huakuii TaxID=1421019 RepID=UPI000496AF0B|nr:hypothetical protein [Kurthia huakuii]MBM7697876.1 outer membrane lipoprotein-sorting protein [Kurthia huakuii]